jgi:hypothetical protein
VITDYPPASGIAKRQFEESDALTAIELPPAEELRALARELEQAMATGERGPVTEAGEAILRLLARTHGIGVPQFLVLGSRPKGSYELYGDYDFEHERIRAWMRTAVHGRVTSFKGFLHTLLHEYCHHLDRKKLGFEETPHTRGFYARNDELYHLALGTSPENRKPLVWLRTGRIWRVDWSKLRRPVP